MMLKFQSLWQLVMCRLGLDLKALALAWLKMAQAL